MREPSEHVDVSHKYTKEISTDTNKQKSQTTLSGPLSSIKKPTLPLNIDKTNNQGTLQNNVKANQKSIQQRTMEDYNTKVNLIGGCKNKREDFPKGYCLSVVHAGVNKMLFNAAVIENCKCNIKSLNEFQKFSEQLTGSGIPPPLEVTLTKKLYLQN